MRIRTTHDLASVMRGRRRELGISQAELAMRASVSRDWLNTFERGKRTVELSLVFRLVDTLGLEIELTVPDASEAADASASRRLDSILEAYLDR
jgi:transcriptional regulator with XRE-family HTH domain